jgi:4'-phosphopantetheinyl transferase EntD
LHLHLWQVTEPLDFFADNLPAHVRAGIQPQWHAMRQLQYSAARWLLYQHIDPAQPLVANERGAPSLPDSDLQISFSHSPGYVGVLLGQGGSVGLDLEQPDLPRNWDTARVFMNADELAHYQQHRSPESFLRVWCAKEALFKVMNRHWTDISFKRELWTQPITPGAYPTCVEGGMRRDDAIDVQYTLHLDAPMPNLMVAALHIADAQN